VQTQAENAGAQEIARRLADGAAKRGWDASQIFFYRRTESFDDDPTAFFCAARRPTSPLGVLALLFTLFRKFRADRPDVVVTLQHYGNVVAAPLARLAGARLVIANQLSAAAVVPAKLRLADKIIGILGGYDHIVVNSIDTEAEYRAYPARYSRHITRIDHGFFDKSLDIGKHEARAELALPPDAPLLGCAARLHPLKKLDLAIRLLTQDPARHLAIAGQGAEREALEALAIELGVADRTHFLGELASDRMGVFFAALDCFVFPSAAETFGLAPVEAAQAGVPVVANGLEILREVLAVDGAPCARFVDADDIAAFSAEVDLVLKDDALRATMIERGRRLAQRFPLDAMIDGYMALMRETA